MPGLLENFVQRGGLLGALGLGDTVKTLQNIGAPDYYNPLDELLTPEQRQKLKLAAMRQGGAAMLSNPMRYANPMAGMTLGQNIYDKNVAGVLDAAAQLQKMKQAQLEQQAGQQAAAALAGGGVSPVMSGAAPAPTAAPTPSMGAAGAAPLASAPASGGANFAMANRFLAAANALAASGQVAKAQPYYDMYIKMTEPQKPQALPADVVVAQMLADPNVSEDVKTELRKLSQSKGTNIQISTGEKATGKFGETLASKQAEAFSGVVEAAKSAPDIISQANRLESIINDPKVIVGPGADYRLALASALNVAGANNEESIANTQNAISALADTTLTNIKASGLGTGQGFTDKDLKFLERARSGNISFTKERLRDLIRIQRIAANNLVNKFNREVAAMPAETRSVLAASGVAPTYLPSPMTPPAMPTETPSAAAPAPAPAPAVSGWGIRKIGD